ncbi:hypothetical protein [Pseudactinotalea suaedae]|uniref:hypothetical protein n=1 Tax=Pseudactinotalea suaedae TaxID=1524924 RepID=UPI0012E30E48|nr:hypothetical protein [Pseudactinotalea suaedae]
MTAVVAATGLPSSAGVHLGRVLRSEWGKSWGLRSTRWAVAATVAINASMALLMSLDSLVGAEGYGNSLAYVVAGNFLFAQLPLLVYGALMGAGEFSTGSAASTLSAVPRRGLVLLAKTLTAAGTAAVAAIAAVVVSAAILLVGPLGPDLHVALDDGQSVRILVGGAVTLVLLAVLALGVGALLRRPLVAIAVMFALGMSELALIGADAVAQWLPGHALLAVTALNEFVDLVASMGTTVVGPWGSVGVLGAWALLALLLAGARLRRSDV